jgi:carbon-monoxide dehydrogenase medium subunit
MKEKKCSPPHVVDLCGLDDLKRIDAGRSGIGIGALATHSSVARSAALADGFAALSQAAGLIGSWQIRNVGTIGGNLCQASPAGDCGPPLLVMAARLILVAPDGERELDVGSFFTGPGTTALRPTEMLKGILLPPLPGRSRSIYLKLMRKAAVDLAVVGVAMRVDLEESGGRLERVAIGLGGVAPTPIRAPEAESILSGLDRDAALSRLSEAARAAAAAALPITDVRATAEYRRAMVEVFVRRAGERLLGDPSTKREAP